MPLYRFLEQCDWSDWVIGDCSKTCGGGERTKTRTLLNGDIGNCGDLSVVEACNVQSCTGNTIDIIFMRT